MYEKIKRHIGHNVVVVWYGNKTGKRANVAVECEDCNEVIVDEDMKEKCTKKYWSATCTGCEYCKREIDQD